MWSLTFRRYDDELIARLWEAGTTGLIEEADLLRAFFNDDTNSHELSDLGGEFHVETEHSYLATDNDWEPIPVGERFLIVPDSYNAPPSESRLLLRLETGAAFGTGRHETTQLCLAALAQYVKPGANVLDVGCGSGVLSQAALLLGAARVFSCDIDRDSVDMTRRNATTPVFLGSADAIASQSIDIVVANLTARILDRIAWDLHRITKPAGIVLLSGFLRDDPPQHFTPHREFENAGWHSWICHPQNMNAAAPPAEGLTHAAEWWL